MHAIGVSHTQLANMSFDEKSSISQLWSAFLCFSIVPQQTRLLLVPTKIFQGAGVYLGASVTNCRCIIAVRLRRLLFLDAFETARRHQAEAAVSGYLVRKRLKQHLTQATVGVSAWAAFQSKTKASTPIFSGGFPRLDSHESFLMYLTHENESRRHFWRTKLSLHVSVKTVKEERGSDTLSSDPEILLPHTPHDSLDRPSTARIASPYIYD